MYDTPPIVRGGMVREQALQNFQRSVNRPDTMFSTDRWLLPKLEVLKQFLHDPISQDEANALLDVLYEKCRMADLIEWIQGPEMTWANFFVCRRFKEQEAERAKMEEYRIQDEQWARRQSIPLTSAEQKELDERKREAMSSYLQKAHPCPRCVTPPEYLEWYSYCSPPSSWARLMGRAGWRTRCKHCLQEIDFFCEMMN